MTPNREWYISMHWKKLSKLIFIKNNLPKIFQSRFSGFSKPDVGGNGTSVFS